jgi:hypothetical protein
LDSLGPAPFLAPRRFAAKAQIRTVGLSWISLDSLVRIEPFQWVARIFRKKKILAPFSAPGALDGGRGSQKAQRYSSREPNLISDDLQ